MAELPKEEVQKYLADHNLTALLETALNACVASKSADPKAWLSAYLGGNEAKYMNDPKYGADVKRIAAIKVLFPENRAMKHFDFDYFDTLDEAKKERLLVIAKSGIMNPDSGMGCYAMAPDDYDTFKPFFKKVLADYHSVSEDAQHVNDWTLAGVEGLPEGGVLDIGKLGFENDLSMRVRVGRNLKSFPLPGGMTQEDRVNMELKMCGAFDQLIADGEYGGAYYSLTPGHKNHIDDAKYDELVKAHIMFKDMSADSFLLEAGIAQHWPFGRGCYVSEDKGFIVWVGEEDHLRIMCMKKGKVLNEIFNRLEKALNKINTIEGLEFAKSPDYGYVTSCPTNLGTGMRASLHIKLPKLTADGQGDPHGNSPNAKAIAKPLGLSVRGTGGEHTPIDAEGTVDISPSARFCIKESQIITNLYLGIKQMKEADDKL
jgi:protein-arginine kinase